MVALEIEPGTFVWYTAKGLGRVQRVGADDASVLFWADKKSGRTEKIPLYLGLKPLPGNAPEGKPGDYGFAAWTRKAPLTMVAIALHECGGTGRDSDIRENLVYRALLPSSWSSWWNRVQPKLDNLPEHFYVSKTSYDAMYTLRSAVADVPLDTRKPTNLLPEWQDWFWGGRYTEPPENYPKKAITDAIAKWPEDTTEPTLKQAIRGAEGFLASKKPTPQATLGWLEAVGQASRRWWECTFPYPGRYLPGQCSEILLKLAKSAGYAKSGEWLLWAHALSGQADESWMQGFAAGMWATIGEAGGNASRNRRNLFRVTSEMLGRQSRADLAREIALAAFRDTDVSPRYSELDELDQILAQLTPGEGAKRLLELIALSSEAAPRDKNRLLDYIANSRYATGPERLNLLVLATLLLTDGKGPVAAQASRELDGILARLDKSIPAAQALFRDARARIEGEVTKTVDSYDRLLEQGRRDQLRLQQLVRDLAAELDSNREESRLEIRRDMLLIVGEVLQSVRRRDSLDEVVGDVEAGLRLALIAGGAELLDKAPEGYDPQRHFATEAIQAFCPVKITAPGVIVRGNIHGDLVLLKARVISEVA